jgi:hypothetical protein
MLKYILCLLFLFPVTWASANEEPSNDIKSKVAVIGMTLAEREKYFEMRFKELERRIAIAAVAQT